MQLKEPQPGKIATTGQVAKVVRELNNLGQTYGTSAGGKPTPSTVLPVKVTSATDFRGFYNVTRYTNPRYPDPTADVAAIDLGQPITGAIGLYAAEIEASAPSLKADGTEYAAGVFMHNDETGKPVYLLLMSSATGSGALMAIITDDSLAIGWYGFQLVERTATAFDSATDLNLADYYTATGLSLLGYNRAESGKAYKRLNVGDFVEVTLDGGTLADPVYRMTELETGCET